MTNVLETAEGREEKGVEPQSNAPDGEDLEATVFVARQANVAVSIPRRVPHTDIDDPELHDVIAARAFERWVAAGRPPGTALEDWLTAEHEVRGNRTSD